MIDYAGQTLEGKYRVLRLLGEGGMGRVYLGEHALIGRPVAIKFLHAELASNEEVVRRFYREAQAAAAIRHRNVIDVFDVGVSPEREPFLVMEYLEGESLSGMMARVGVLDLPTACGVLEPALAALQAAHERGVVHRDLKPDNIFLAREADGPPTVKLIDFGISKLGEAAGRTRLTRDGSLLGTPEYMSPEQARGVADLDHRTDIYSIGVILYEMLTGGLPFVGANTTELLMAVLTAEPRPPHDVYPAFPDAAVAVIGPALARDPADRFQTAAEMLEALRRLPDFARGRETLARLAPGRGKGGVASGDLGAPLERARTHLAEDVLEQVIRERAPGRLDRIEDRVVALVGRVPGSARLVDRLGGGRRGTRRLLAAIGALLLSVLLSLALFVGGGEGAADGREDTVTITVRGAAGDARIYWDGYLVTENPFRVERKEALVPLRVESSGRKPFKISVSPGEDRVVVVAAGAGAPEPAGAPTAGSGGAGTPTGTADPAPRKGKRKSRVRQFFEGLGN